MSSEKVIRFLHRSNRVGNWVSTLLLARDAGMRPAEVTELLVKLETEGFVERSDCMDGDAWLMKHCPCGQKATPRRATFILFCKECRLRHRVGRPLHD